MQLSVILLFVSSFSYVHCWDTKEMQMFDLVEELKENFYDFLGVTQNATSAEIRRAYRRKSLKYHPDKNEDDPKAGEVFKQLVSVYEVLKDEKLRERYNDVLANGLPTWRQPVFYYRQLRKMGLMETLLLVFLITTVGHYFVLWGAYFEHKLNVDSYVSGLGKKKKKKLELSEEMFDLQRPRVIHVWPIALTIGTYRFIRDFPTICRDTKAQVVQLVEEWREKRRKAQEEQEAIERELEEREKKKELKKKRKAEKAERMRSEMASNAAVAGDKPVVYSSGVSFDCPDADAAEMKTGPWGDDDWLLLTRAMVRFSQGVPERWQRIAEKVGRPVDEVTAKAKEMRERGDMPMSANVQHSISGLDANVLNGRVDGGITMRESAFEIVENEVCGSSSDEEEEYESARQRRQARRRKKRQVDKRPEMDADEEETQPDAKVSPSMAEEKEKAPETVFPDSVTSWSQDEQRLLEGAIRKFPKGTHDRWDRISEHVASRSKTECMDRFRYLTERVKAKAK